MLLKSSISFIEEFFSLTLNQLRKIYLKSNIYKFMISKKYKLVNWIHDDLVFISKTSNLL